MSRLLEWLFGVSGADFAGADGWSLRLAGMPANAALLLALFALFGFLGWLTVRCYLREGATPRRTKLAIAALRLAVLFFVFLVILQPALLIRFARTERGVVAVLVDDTLSMRWRDRYTDDKERAALAAVLGVSDPARELAGDDRLTRSEAVRRALVREGGVLSRLAADHPILLYRFGVTGGSSSYIASLGGGSDAGLANASTVAGGEGGIAEAARAALAGLRTEGSVTDLGRALRETLSRLEGRRVAALVVLSDGRETALAKARLAGAVQMAQQRGVPVFAVAVGDPVPPRNVAVTQLVGPREVRAGSKISFTALVTARSLPPTTIPVRLLQSRSGQEDWDETGARAEVTVGGESAAPHATLSLGERGTSGAQLQQLSPVQEVTLVTEAPAVGVYAFKARIEAPREDSIAEDNEASTVVRVTDQKMKVLLIGGSASWEFQFLRNFLLRSKDHYAVTVWQQNADERFNQDASTGMKRSTLPATVQELAAYDVVVLCDPRHVPGSFDERFLELLDGFVGKHQGGMCYLAGGKFAGRSFSGRGALEPLAALLPVVLAPEELGGPRGAGERDTMALQLTSEGQAHPVLRFAADLSDSLATWRRLPGVYRSQRALKLKPLAAALAVVSSTLTPQTPDLSSEPSIAVQYYGRGRVLALVFDGTWRWRAIDDTAQYERFWSNTMEFLGAGRLEKNRIVVTTAGDTFDAGTDIQVRVEAYNRDLNPLEAKSLVLKMRARDSGEAVSHTLRRERPGLYAGTLRADRVGTYELDVAGDETGVADWLPEDVSTRVIQVRLPQAEFRHPEADFDALGELAGSESRFLRLHQLDALPAKIPPGSVLLTSEAPHPVWHTKFMLILLGALLIAEWTLRKLHRMM